MVRMLLPPDWLSGVASGRELLSAIKGCGEAERASLDRMVATMTDSQGQRKKKAVAGKASKKPMSERAKRKAKRKVGPRSPFLLQQSS